MTKGRRLKRENGYRVGVHTSIAGGISRAVESAAQLHATTMQIFSHNPRQWQKIRIPREEAERFWQLRKRHDVNPAFIHSSYLINLAASSGRVLHKSIDLLSYELANADELQAEYVILHTGSAGAEEGKTARVRAVRALEKAVGGKKYKASLLLENTAGEKGDITSSVQALAEIIDACSCDMIAGICIDTCHAFSAGYDLATHEGIDRMLSEIKKYIGLDKLKLIHLNDSKNPLGKGVDRHQHIGQGYIGLEGFRKILSDERISNVPLILETPKSTEDDDRRNLKKVFQILDNLKS